MSRTLLLLLASSLLSQLVASQIAICHNDQDVQFCTVGGKEYGVISNTGEIASRYSDCHYHDEELHCDLPGGGEVELAPTHQEHGHDHSHEEEHQAGGEEHVTATACYNHDNEQFCIVNGEEHQVMSNTGESASAYRDCHSHDEEVHCTLPGGGEVLLAPLTNHDHEEIECHSHAGVEHCVGPGAEEAAQSCERPEQDHNIPIRIGLLFVILVTSSIGVFGPIFVHRLTSINLDGTIFVGLRQFGAGVIISTALVHLLTHAELYFSSPCLPPLEYEATASSIAIAGLFVTFIIELIGFKLIQARARRNVLATNGKGGPPVIASKAAVSVDENAFDESVKLQQDQTILSATVMEAGIIFHSILIGLILVVAGDSAFITLFVVILFHQMFEGIALGSRIALMSASMLHKMAMATAFAIITPIGMAIGIGVLSSFNGNDPATLIAIATLNAFSAGILLWIGLVEMWAGEWWRGPLKEAGWLKLTVGMLGLVFGLALMSLLGKWA